MLSVSSLAFDIGAAHDSRRQHPSLAVVESQTIFQQGFTRDCYSSISLATPGSKLLSLSSGQVNLDVPDAFRSASLGRLHQLRIPDFYLQYFQCDVYLKLQTLHKKMNFKLSTLNSFRLVYFQSASIIVAESTVKGNS
ncbi:hypothetical protein JTE90_004589 [Oedothorax gibbosus]|uniref:Uncharacterized protein n=1 Tax=Oedothorax gibbosus TaxID=931172 RepID=A0AAV6UL41_9ARAC|nr:hypothetical protein JTE90_004589 [Oedothorax gibbosus]